MTLNFSRKPEEIKSMFNKIAFDYDFLNNLISFYTHFLIKNEAVKQLDIKPDSRILDLCTGSGDLAFIVKKYYPSTKITGVDFSDKMLEIARKKHPDIEFYKGDVTKLEFQNNSFDYVLIGFGFRNILDKEAVLSEIQRVLDDNGKFLHLDFGEKNFISKTADFLILFMAKLFSRNFQAYKYLIESKKEFFTPLELIKFVEKFDFKLEKRKDFLFKVISCEVFKKV